MKYLLTLLQVIGILTSGLLGNAITETSDAAADTLTPVALAADGTTIVAADANEPEDTAATDTAATSDPAPPSAPEPPEPPEPTTAPSAIATTSDVSTIDMDECAKCICWSWSSCDATFCDSRSQLCDMYHIDYPAWRASGSPSIPDREFPNPVSAFEHCRSNATCAIKTISQYFELHKADCNRDGVIDCEDVTIIHTVGPQICKDPPKTMHVVGVAACMADAKAHADAIRAGKVLPPRRRPTQKPRIPKPRTMQPWQDDDVPMDYNKKPFLKLSDLNL